MIIYLYLLSPSSPYLILRIAKAKVLTSTYFEEKITNDGSIKIMQVKIKHCINENNKVCSNFFVNLVRIESVYLYPSHFPDFTYWIIKIISKSWLPIDLKKKKKKALDPILLWSHLYECKQSVHWSNWRRGLKVKQADVAKQQNLLIYWDDEKHQSEIYRQW